MLSTLLVQFNTWVPAAAAAIVLVVALLGAGVLWVVREPSRPLWWLTGLSTAAVLVLTLTPTSRRAFEFCVIEPSVPGWGSSGIIANAVMFVPAAVFAVLATRRPLLVLLAGSALSALIELTQALIPALGRSCDADDWLANTSGTVIGVAVAVVVGWLHRRRVAADPPVTSR